MAWAFDQAPNVACIACRSVIDGAPVLLVIHYADDDSWAFLDGQPFDPNSALVVAMKTIIDAHPTLGEIGDLLSGWSATRLYFRFTLSFRDVEEMLAQRGIDVSYETIRCWTIKVRPPDRSQPEAQAPCSFAPLAP